MPIASALCARATRLPVATWCGVAAAMLLYICAVAFSAATLPWRGTADAFAHMDYVYQIHHGQIPEPNGYAYRLVSPRKFNVGNPDTTRQWASAHPPLFYALASLPMGSELDAGRWEMAMARGRALNMVLGAGCVLALAWAGWSLGGRRRARLAVALPLVGGCLPPFVRFSAEVYNDILVTLLSIVAVVLACQVLLRGAARTRCLLLAVTCALGMASKATFVFALVIAMAALALRMLGGTRASWPLRVTKAAAASFALAAAAFLPNAWFFLRNATASGSWFRSSVKEALQGRVEKSLFDVLGDDTFWLLVPRSLLGSRWEGFWPHNQQLSILVTIACAAGLLSLAVHNRWPQRLLAGEPLAWAWVLVALHFAGLMLAQLQQATGWGQYNVRYFLPALLSLSAFLVAAPAASGRSAPWLVPPLAALMAFSGVRYTFAYLDRAYASLAKGEDSWTRMLAAVDGNGLSHAWVWLSFAGMLVAILAGAVCLARLSSVPDYSPGC